MASPSSHPPARYLAPRPSSSASPSPLAFPSHEGECRLPAVDAHIVVPETREEMWDGERILTSPAEPAHAIPHADLAALLRAYVAPGYLVAVDMLTRTSEDTEFAPDASIFAAGDDPDTGGRKLEEAVFEIVSTQTLRRAADKAFRLFERGV